MKLTRFILLAITVACLSTSICRVTHAGQLPIPPIPLKPVSAAITYNSTIQPNTVDFFIQFNRPINFATIPYDYFGISGWHDYSNPAWPPMNNELFVIRSDAVFGNPPTPFTVTHVTYDPHTETALYPIEWFQPSPDTWAASVLYADLFRQSSDPVFSAEIATMLDTLTMQSSVDVFRQVAEPTGRQYIFVAALVLCWVYYMYRIRRTD